MSYDKELALTIQRYLKDARGEQFTVEEILTRPRYVRVWTYWKALAYYGEDSHYTTLEAAPEGLVSVVVMGDAKRQYRWKDGRYEQYQAITYDECKSAYGN